MKCTCDICKNSMLWGPAGPIAPPLQQQMPIWPGLPPVGKPLYYNNNDPYKYAMDNKLDALEFNTIKYITRHKGKNGKQDLIKASDTLNRMINNYETLYDPK